MLTPTQPRNASPDLSCLVKRTVKDSISLGWVLWHTTLPGSVGITLRLYQVLNLGQTLFLVASPQPPPPPPLPILSLPYWDLLTLDKKNPKHVPCFTTAKTDCWLSDGGHKAWKGEKTWPISLFFPLPPSSLFYLSTLMFTFFFSWLLCLSRLTWSFVYTNPFSCARSIFLVFFPFNTCEYFLAVVLIVTSPVPQPPLSCCPHSLTLPPTISLIICLCLCWSANNSLLANSWDWSFLHGWVDLLKGSLSSLSPNTRLLHGTVCITHTPAGKTLKPYHLKCTGLNSQEEREAVGEQERRRRKRSNVWAEY